MSDATLLTIISSIIGSGGLVATLGTLWVKNRESDASKYEVVLNNLLEQARYLSEQLQDVRDDNKVLRETNERLRCEADNNRQRIADLERGVAKLEREAAEWLREAGLAESWAQRHLR